MLWLELEGSYEACKLGRTDFKQLFYEIQVCSKEDMPISNKWSLQGWNTGWLELTGFMKAEVLEERWDL